MQPVDVLRKDSDAVPSERRLFRSTPQHARDIIIALDSVMVMLGAVLAKFLYIDLFQDTVLGADYLSVALATAAICHVLLRSHRKAAIDFAPLPATSVAHALLLGFGFVVIAGYMLKISESYSRGWMLVWFALSYVAIIGKDRLSLKALRYFAGLGFVQRNTAIYGASEASLQLMRDLKNAEPVRISVEIYDDAPQPGLEVRGGLSTLIQDGLNGHLERVIFCLPPERLGEIARLVDDLSFLPANIQICPQQPDYVGLNPKVTYASGRYFIDLLEKPLDTWHGAGKRLMDLVLGSVFALLALPIGIVIAILIKLDSKGPVFFKQNRHGYNHRNIEVFKFRTMHVLENGSSVPQATRDDPRITRIGRFLRRSSLDELPQLINVLIGNMSLVGPRPHAVSHNDYYSERLSKYADRHKVKPGMTGWAQINGFRGGTENMEDMAKRAAADLYYIENWSLWFDFKILLMTPIALLFGRNAY
jgi:putative colanic acid biosynthesis UDP-glucose lipid carrier transferase